MIITPAGTRALARKYLKALEEEYILGLLSTEEELSKRIGNKNAIVIDNKVISAHKGEIQEGKIFFWIVIHNRIQLDKEDDQLPVIETAFDNLEEIEEQPSKISKMV